MSAPLKKYHDIAEAIALLFRPYVEVVLHDIKSEQVVYIANNFSQRELGEPSLLHEIDFSADDHIIGPYEKINWDGKRIKSVSAVLRDDSDKAIGILCINTDVSHFYMAKQAFDALISVPQENVQPDALFKEDWHEKINQFVTDWSTREGTPLPQLAQKQKKQLVLALADNGGFNGKNSVAYVSRILGMARATVYNYLKQHKGS